MSRDANFKPKYSATRKRWVLNVPASASPDGKRKREYFESSEEAKERGEQLKMLKNSKSSNVKHASSELIADAVEFDHIAQELGFSGLREAFNKLITEYERRERAPTLRDLMDKWENDRKDNWSPTYLETRWLPFRGYFLEEHLATSIATMDEEYWRDWLSRWQKKEFIPIEKRKKHANNKIDKTDVYQKATYNQVLGIIRSLFGQRMALKHHPISPLKSIADMKHEVDGKKKEKCVFTPEDTRLLLETTLEYQPGLIPYFAIMLFAGARPDSEIYRVTWNDINFEEKWVRLKITKTNHVDVRYVPLEPALEAWLRPFRQSKGFVAPRKGLRRRKDNVVKGYYTTKGAQARRKDKWIALVEWGHDVTRHSYASYWEAAHRNEPACFERLAYNMGHMKKKTYEENYKNSRTPKEAEAYWSIFPPETVNNVEYVEFGT